MLPYRPVKLLLWAALAAAWTFALVSRFSPGSLLLLAFVVIAQPFWLLSHATQLRKSYLRNEAAASIQTPHDRFVWGANRKPRPVDLAVGIALLGMFGFYMAYEVSIGAAPTKFAKLAYDLFGIVGAVGIWSLAGVTTFALGVETLIGGRKK